MKRREREGRASRKARGSSDSESAESDSSGQQSKKRELKRYRNAKWTRVIVPISFSDTTEHIHGLQQDMEAKLVLDTKTRLDPARHFQIHFDPQDYSKDLQDKTTEAFRLSTETLGKRLDQIRSI
jgi:hypothetical protein